jgi:hypothetical protein
MLKHHICKDHGLGMNEVGTIAKRPTIGQSNLAILRGLTHASGKCKGDLLVIKNFVTSHASSVTTVVTKKLVIILVTKIVVTKFLPRRVYLTWRGAISDEKSNSVCLTAEYH